MRVGIVALLHESNTFVAQPTSLEHFQQDLLLRGDEVRAMLVDTRHEIGGFFSGLERAGIEPVSIFAARAIPHGAVTGEAFAALFEMMFGELTRAAPLDAILAAAHGAMVSHSAADADGHWLGELRRRVGPQMPIVATLDAHANLSPAIVAACDALIPYRTNPHLDQYERGLEAAALLHRTLRGEVRPTMAAAFPPLAINIERQLTSEPPCRPLYEQAAAMRERPGVLSTGILLGYPYADVVEMGSAVVAVTDNNKQLAHSLANELAASLWQQRNEFLARLISVDEVLDQVGSEPGPIGLLDMGDNVGGGSPGDGTHLAHAIHERRIGRSFVCLCDPEAVQQAAERGPGARVRMAVGGKSDRQHGEPLEAEFTIEGFFDGKFVERETRHGALTHCDQGATAIVHSDDGLAVMLTSRRMPPFSLGQLTSCGLNAASFRILVAKGVHAPVAAYGPVCRRLIRVDTRGVTTADLSRLSYRRRRRPMFPFEPQTTWRPMAAD